MADGVFVLVDERMKVLRRASYEHDVALPALLARHPEIIAGAASDGGHRRLLLVERRKTGGDSAGWLYVDSDGVPVLVELATAGAARPRREALGRLLDQVASGVPDWHGRRTRDVVRTAHPSRPEDQILVETVGWHDSADAFWARVESNLFHHRVRIVFVGHRLSDDLLRMIAFLDQQLRDIEVLGVEVTHYGSGPIQAVVPRLRTGTGCAAGSVPEPVPERGPEPGSELVPPPPPLPPLPQRIPMTGKHRRER